MIATRTRVACVVVFVMDMPLKLLLSVLVLMAFPNLDRIALELKEKATNEKAELNGSKSAGAMLTEKHHPLANISKKYGKKELVIDRLEL